MSGIHQAHASPHPTPATGLPVLAADPGRVDQVGRHRVLVPAGLACGPVRRGSVPMTTRATIGGLFAVFILALNLGVVVAILVMAGWVVVRFVFR